MRNAPLKAELIHQNPQIEAVGFPSRPEGGVIKACSHEGNAEAGGPLPMY